MGKCELKHLTMLFVFLLEVVQGLGIENNETIIF